MISTGKAEYISTAVAYLRANHLRMLIYDLRYTGSNICDKDNVNIETTRNIIDN